jgi:cell pole-organizing protein PopZ
MTQPAKGQEPSMEEILASIRRIIADDDPARPPDESRPPAHETFPPQPTQPPSAPPRMASRPEPAPARAAPSPMSDPETRDEDIDSMLAQLQATSRQPPAAVEEPPASERTPEPAPALRSFNERADMESEKRPSEPAAARAVEERRPAAAEMGDRGLVSAATTATVASAFHSLAQTVQMRNDRTLEDLVSEILRPMLKAWLDENLPTIVERLVRAEIERMSRGRG